jgi:predicted nucleotidyltransferase
MSSRDYEEFLESLNGRGVRYLVVGAHAVAFHARPRATKDLDVLIEPTVENGERVLAAIRDFFGGSDLGVTVSDLTDPDSIVQLGVAPSRIDLLSKLAAFPAFQPAWNARAQGRFGGVETQYLSLDDLLREKEATGRDQDRADAKALRRAKERRPR